MKIILTIIFILSIDALYASLIVSGSQDTIVSERQKSIYSIEIWKKPIDPATGRRKIGVMKNERIATLSGFHIGRGYILTAAHAFADIQEAIQNNKQSGYLIKIFDYQNRPIPDLQIGKCGESFKNGKPDICVLKGELYEKQSFFELPKELNLDPTSSIDMGLINKSRHIYKQNALIQGSFQESLNHEDGINKGIKLWITNIKTDIGNSGSPIFDLATGKVLGMTTNSIKIKGEQKAEVIPIQYIRSYLNEKDWKLKSIPENMQSYGAILYKKSLKESLKEKAK
jgi:hypothetical protein